MIHFHAPFWNLIRLAHRPLPSESSRDASNQSRNSAYSNSEWKKMHRSKDALAQVAPGLSRREKWGFVSVACNTWTKMSPESTGRINQSCRIYYSSITGNQYGHKRLHRGSSHPSRSGQKDISMWNPTVYKNLVFCRAAPLPRSSILPVSHNHTTMIIII